MRTLLFKIFTLICALILIAAVIFVSSITQSLLVFVLSILGAVIVIFPWFALISLSKDAEEMANEIVQNRKMLEKFKADFQDKE